MSYLLVTSPIHGVFWVQLNRGEKRNALCQELMQELSHKIDEFEASSHQVLVISGGDDFFSAGMDLNEVYLETASSMKEAQKVGDMWQRLSSCSKPTIASVSGIAFGGGFELALMCDMIIASNRAQFRFPEITVGTIPGLGGSVRLKALAGPKITSHMILSALPLDAQRAYQLGIINQIAEHEHLEQATLTLAQKIQAHPLPLLQSAKKAIKGSHNLKTELDHERDLFYSTFDLVEQKEKMRAFLKK